MWNYMCIRWLINWSDSTKMHGATIRFIISDQVSWAPRHFAQLQSARLGRCSRRQAALRLIQKRFFTLEYINSGSHWGCFWNGYRRLCGGCAVLPYLPAYLSIPVPKTSRYFYRCTVHFVVYVITHTHTHTHTYIYIYIYNLRSLKFTLKRS